MNIKTKLFISGLAAALTTGVIAQDSGNMAADFDVKNCSYHSDGEGFDFCGDRARRNYTQTSSENNINFADKYVLIDMKEKSKSGSDRYIHHLAAINPADNTVYSFPFTVRDQDASKDIKFSISRDSDAICMPANYFADSNREITSYGGMAEDESTMCFKFMPSAANNFATIPTYEEVE